MEDWKERLVKETLELNDRAIKLDRFIHTEEFHLIDASKQRLLEAQKAAMDLYLHVLVDRIMNEDIPLPFSIKIQDK